MANNGIKSDGKKPPRLMPSIIPETSERQYEKHRFNLLCEQEA